MRNYEISKTLRKTLEKLRKKDKHKYTILLKKLQEIINSNKTLKYKNLKNELKHFKRVHINSHLVLIFREEKNKIIFERFSHHDEAYKTK